jgi:hypothetical protein
VSFRVASTLSRSRGFLSERLGYFGRAPLHSTADADHNVLEF